MTDKNEKNLPGMGEPPATLTPEGGPVFDPRMFPGAEVVYDDTDEDGSGLSVIAIPLSSVQGAGGLNAITAIMDNFRQIGWAKDEATKAMERHGEKPPADTGEGAGPIYNALSLCACVLQPYMAPEQIFRAHCSEIFERVAKGEDTQPGTDAEILGLLVDAAQAMQFCGGLICLYFRLVKSVLPDMYNQFKAGYEADGPEHDHTAFEQEHGKDADEHYTELREFLTRDRTKA